MMCALYGVTRAGFYAWQARLPSERSQQDTQLLEQGKRPANPSLNPAV